ncbi:MAG: choice-of-anchor J domain-containing protein, partial [Muribaculaceae bacterium]|nr:choice-of-anchor J domain-containing protein [Muribaculaceae bacterium]
MKKNLTRFFSLMLAAFTALSVTASPLQRRAEQAKYNLPGFSTPVTKSPAAAQGEKSLLKRPQVDASSKGLFKSSFKITDLNVTTPNKLGARAEVSDLPKLIGSVLWSENFSANGLYTIPTNSSQDFTRLFKYPNAEYGGVLVDDTYFTCENFEFPGYGSNIIYTGYDINTGKETFEVSGAYYTYSMTYDETTSTVYAIANIEGIFALTKISFDTEKERVLFEPIAGIQVDSFGLWNALACDSKGQLWAVYSDADENSPSQLLCTGSTLYKIDKNTAVATKIGETGYDSLYASDAIFDLRTDRLLWTVMNTDDEGFLTEIDTTTGEATIVYAFPGNEQVTGLAIPKPEADDEAPAAVTDVTANFANGSLSGTIDFKAPSTLFNGSEGSGDITYTILANGSQVATGTTTFGADVAAPVTVNDAGFYTFTVSVSNDKGESPKVEIKTYVGADTPVSTSVTANFSDGVMTVNWLPVTTSINGGYIDVDNVTYTVTRYPDKEVVANKISATTFTETLPEPSKLTTYYYGVVVNAGELSSAQAVSNSITLGTVTPPFTATFEDSLDGFNVIDANGDGNLWTAIDGHARMVFNSAVDMDDWLVSPGLKLTAETLYDISAQFACGNPSFPERIEVKAGKSPKPEDMTIVLLEPTVITQKTDAPMDWNKSFVPETDGTYYIAFHGISDKNKFTLYVDNFAVSEPKGVNTPEAVSGLTATPGANGALTATISFTTPSTTLSGGELSSLTKVELLRNDKLINTWTDPAVNATLTYTDNLNASGTYTYTVIAYSAAGNGPESVVSAYVGVDYPSVVSGVNAFETDSPGVVT